MDRLATEALKSYAEKFEPEEHPEDYKLVRSIIVVLRLEFNRFAGHES